MRKILLLTLATAVVANANAQYVENFETPILAADTAWYGQDQITDGDTIYSNGPIDFELNYNSGFGSFTGWAVSSETDNVTPGYGNQFAATTGEGAESSSQYGICYVASWANNRLFLTTPSLFYEMKITNTTYAYQSMLNGDSYGKKFGEDTSATGVIDGTNGEDWFLLTIYALGADSLHNGDSINYYLADYRFANDSEDYIIDTWETIDLTSLNGNSPIGLDFVLNSSDTTGGLGMNTPAYFAIDDLYIGSAGITSNEVTQLEVYPNPATNLLNIQSEMNATLQLLDLNGRLIREEKVISANTIWDISAVEAGIYQLQMIIGEQRSQAKIVKQ